MKYTYTGLDGFRKWLITQGYTIYGNGFKSASNGCDWYAAKKTKLAARECECNDGKAMQIVVYPHVYELSGIKRESCEIDVTGGESSIWFKLQAYSVTPAEFKSRQHLIEAKLIAAWNALSTKE